MQTVTFAMWVKPQGTSSLESINTYRETRSPITLNICKSHVYVIVCARVCNSVCNKDCFSVIDQGTGKYQLKMKEKTHVKLFQLKYTSEALYPVIKRASII